MPPDPATYDVHAKALALNLDPSAYGTIAEIGGGQEVARWFLRVGAASGTVAQTVSAYDKTVSDERYGAGTRYVSRERLLAMLDREYELLLRRLSGQRGADTRFFAFANTVAARNYRGDNEQHGWVGVRFQSEPGGPPNDVRLHVNLRDPTAELQQEALGLLGVNLIHAAYCRRDDADSFLSGLFDELSVHRIELDVLELSGPAFEGVDNRLWSVQAVRRGMSHAVVFDRTGHVVEPSTILRKRPLVVERGRFKRLAPFHAELLRGSEEQLHSEGVPLDRDPVSVLEMTIHHAAGAELDAGLADDAEVLGRVGKLTALAPVIVSDYGPTYQLFGYLRRQTAEPVRLALGASALAQLMQAQFYDGLPGSLLEGLGRLLTTNVKVYVYPMPVDAFRRAMLADGPLVTGHEWLAGDRAAEVVTGLDLRPPPPLDHLYRYLLDAGWIIPCSSCCSGSGSTNSTSM